MDFLEKITIINGLACNEARAVLPGVTAEDRIVAIYGCVTWRPRQYDAIFAVGALKGLCMLAIYASASRARARINSATTMAMLSVFHKKPLAKAAA
jgi:hypothetical protein